MTPTPEILGRFRNVQHHAERLLESFRTHETSSNRSWLSKIEKSITYQVNKGVMRLSDSMNAGVKAFMTVADDITPGNQLQERKLNILEFLNRYGTTLQPAV